MSDMTPEQITKALEAGIITEDQAKSMRQKAAGLKDGPDTNEVSTTDVNNSDAAVIGNEDDMRFLRSFSDVFISIGVGLFALGLSAVAALFGGGLAFIGAAIVMAFMAEYFGRKRRSHAPTLITALAFLIFTQKGVGALIDDVSGITTALVTLGAMLLYYWRIRLPFCIALIAIAALYLVFAIINKLVPGLVEGHWGLALFLSGIAVFAGAVMYDMRDLHRTTRFADNAFWLHFLAAPMIIHGMALQTVALQKDKLFNIIPMVSLNAGDAAIVMVIVAIITVIGLAINRRALIVSSLGYAAFALWFLFNGAGMNFGTVIAMTLLLLGGAIIFLGAGWHTARAWLLKVLPKWKIFPPAFDPDFKV